MATDGLIEALHVAGPAGATAEQLRLFEQFPGSRDISWAGPDAEGRTVTARGEIVLLSDEDDPQLRWRFTDITSDAFTWRCEISRDGGTSFSPDEETPITRR